MFNRNNLRTIIYVFLLTVLLTLGMDTLNPVAIVLALLLIIAGVISRITVSKLSGNVECRIKCPDQAEKDARIRVEIETAKPWMLSFVRGKMSVAVENLLTGENSLSEFPFKAVPARSRKCSLDVTESRCGVIRVRVRNIEMEDLIARHTKTAAAGATKDICVVPKISRINSEAIPEEGNICVLLDNGLSESLFLTPEQKSRTMELFCSVAGTVLGSGIPVTMVRVDTENDGLIVEKITDSKELSAKMPEILSCGFKSTEKSVAARLSDFEENGYKENEGKDNRGFDTILFVTPGEARDTRLLGRLGQVSIFRA